MYQIYKYTNKENGKVYIGQTSTSLESRAQSNGNNYRGSRHFYNAIQKYSWSSFTPEILATVETSDEANCAEQYYIKLYNSTDDNYGYNLLPGGENREMSAETKMLISAKAKERYADRTKNPMYGKHHSDHARQLISESKIGERNPMFGTTWTQAQRERSGTNGKKLNLTDAQRDVLRERARTIGQTTGLRSVRCIEDNAEFSSMTLAANTYGVSSSTLCGHLRGHQKTCAGKHFEYIN